MAEHVALDLEVDALHHLVQVRFEKAHACLRPLVLDLGHKLIDEHILAVGLRLEDAGSDHLLLHDGHVLAGEHRPARRSGVQLRNLHASAAAERIVRSRSPEVALERCSDIAVLVDVAVHQLIESSGSYLGEQRSKWSGHRDFSFSS